MKFGQLRRRIEMHRWEVEHPEYQMYHERIGCCTPLLMTVAVIFILVACKTREVVTEVEYITKDSIVYRDSIIRVDVPYEVETKYCPPVDTLRLQTSLAKASVWMDWNKEMLVGTIQNKNVALEANVAIPTRYITKTIKSKATITVTKEVNRLYWWQEGAMWLGGLVALLVIGWFVSWLARRFRH